MFWYSGHTFRFCAQRVCFTCYKERSIFQWENEILWHWDLTLGMTNKKWEWDWDLGPTLSCGMGLGQTFGLEMGFYNVPSGAFMNSLHLLRKTQYAPHFNPWRWWTFDTVCCCQNPGWINQWTSTELPVGTGQQHHLPWPAVYGRFCATNDAYTRSRATGTWKVD